MKQSRLVRFSKFAILPAAFSLVSCATKTVQRASAIPVAPVRQVTNAVDAGDGDMEIAAFRKSVSANPNDLEARLRLAQAYEAHGFSDVALEHLRVAAERFPDSLPVALRLAQSLHRAGQNDQALAGLKDYLRRNPQQTSEPYEWLGILNDSIGSWKDSQAAYETALRYAPESAELHNNLGNAFLMQHFTSSAAAEFRTALRLQPNLAIARNNLGIALAENPQEAILNWQSVSGPAAAHNNMAALLIERGDYKGARKELETALSYDRHNGQAIFNLALVAELDGKPAVLPAAQTGKPNLLSRLFHRSRHTASSSAQPAVSASAGTGSAVGN